MAAPGARAPRLTRAPALGATVVTKVLFEELGPDTTGRFFKEVSAPGTPIEASESREEPWFAAPR